MMKNFFEEPEERYPDNKDEGLHANLVCDSKDQRPIGRWGRMHGNYLKAMHPELYEHLILNGALHRHLADANERAESMMERLIDQMKHQEGITERLKAEQPMVWVGRMNSIRSRAEEIVQNEVIHNL